MLTGPGKMNSQQTPQDTCLERTAENSHSLQEEAEIATTVHVLMLATEVQQNVVPFYYRNICEGK